MSRRYLLATVAAAALLLPNLARADSTVAALTAAAALAGPELFYCVQSAADHNCTATQLRTFIAASVGTVTSVGLALPGGVFTVSGSPVSGSGTLTATPAGTSGGMPYFSSATSMASSGLLTLNTPVLGGGAGGAPTSGTVSGNTTKFATVNATTFATGQCVQVDASSNLTTTGSACGAGGGGTPGGATTNVQFNNGGVFGGDAGFTYAGNGQVTLALGTITTNNKALNITGTWNNAATTYDAPLFMNVTNTASAAASKLMDLQVGSVSQLSVTPSGGINFGSTHTITWDANFLYINPNVAFYFGSVLQMASTVQFGWTSGAASAGRDTLLSRDAAGIIAQQNGATAQTFRVYNIFNTSSDYERGVLDWTTTANTLTIGYQAAGTGSTGRSVRLLHGNNARLDIGNLSAFITASFDDNLSRFNFYALSPITFANGDTSSTSPTASLANIANTSVMRFGDGGINANGWIQWGGQARVTADFTVTSSTALTNVTGLTSNVQAGRNYTFEAELYVTDAAAGGVQAAIAGTATATAIQYTGYTIADNAIKGKANATALGAAVGSTVTTETAGIVVRITGTITVNAAGTLTVQMAQNTSNATATTAKRGSYLIVQDMP